MEQNKMESFDAIILGAGACGLMCAVQAGYLGKRVLLLEKGPDAGAKIKISGGGRCNYTNLEVSTANFISENPHFANSTFSQWTVDDTLNFFEQFGIQGQEKTLGQIFPVSNKATDIVNVFTAQLAEMQIPIQYQFEMQSIAKLSDQQFEIKGTVNGKQQQFLGRNVVVATGGFPIPKMGATGMAFDIAKQFDIKTTKHAPALVPMVIGLQDRSWYEKLSGISVFAKVSNERISFEENILFTHWGLSGPAILQISSYWKGAESFEIDLLPHVNLKTLITKERNEQGGKLLSTLLQFYLPKKLVDAFADELPLDIKLASLSNDSVNKIHQTINHFLVKPAGDKGYEKAEVMRGGIDTNELSSKTLASKLHPNLFFGGECVDVTGWLGGYNFQWAWASGYVIAQNI
jgi:predicted Rossmann fold flavoprotein